jgi:hypothetical protein
MPGLDWSHLTAEDVLSFGVSVLMVLMIISLAAWFARSAVENVAKTGRWIRRSSYDALLRENERLRDSLMDAREENVYLRKLYRKLSPRESDEGQNAA